jgi:antitoxin VapB
MANQLNIKSEDGYRLATELSLLTGESLTAAVTEALRERLEREQRARDRTAKLARLTALAAEIRASLRPPPPHKGSEADHDFLYDVSGRPR